MREVAIVGAGDLGASLALALARRGCVGRIGLLDANGSVAAGKALDIQQAGAIEGFSTEVRGSDDFRRAAGADVIAIADEAGPPAREWSGEAGLQLLAKLARTDSHSIFLCAGAQQRELVQRGVTELGIPRTRLLGSAPGALASAVRAIVGLELDRSAVDVSVTVLGIPPQGMVVPWEGGALAGQPLTQLLAPRQIGRLQTRLPHLWPPGPYALASAATRVSEAMAQRGHRLFSCFVTLDGEFGARGVAVSAPILVGPRGLIEVAPTPLSARDRIVLDNAIVRIAR